MLVRSVAVLLLLSQTSSARLADTDWPVTRGPSRLPAPYAYDAKTAWKDVPPEYLDDAPACVLYSGTVHRVEADGTIEATTQELIRLNRRKGIDQYGEYRTITFTPSYEKLTLHEARVHKSGGGVAGITPAHVQVRDVNTDHLIYDTGKQVTISFPALEAGDVIEIHWTVRGKHPEYQDRFFYRYTFGNDKMPVARDEWSARLPKGRELKFAVLNGKAEPAIATEGDERVFKWSVANVAASPVAEKQPPADETKFVVHASTFQTWDDVHQWERKLLADRCACTPDVKKVVAEVTKGLVEPIDKAKALTQWVRRQVRYVSTGERHDYTPHPPAQVIAQRFGDCKDTAHLLAVMLREIGLTAGVATLGVRGDGQVLPEVPSPWGSHAITCVAIDGKDHWIDTTANQVGWDVLPRDDRDRACFVSDEKSLRLSRTPPLTPADSVTEQTFVVRVAADGSAKGERVVVYSKLAAWQRREDYVDAPRKEQRRSAVGDLQEYLPKARITELTFDDQLADFDSPLTIRAAFEAPELFAGDKTLQARFTDHSLWGAILAASVNPEREAALDACDPFTSICKYVIHLPPGFRFGDLPDAERLDSAWGTFRLHVRPDGDDPRRLELEFATRIEKGRVAPADFESFESFQEAMQSAFRVTIPIKPTTDIVDAPLMEAVLVKTPGDARTAIALAEMYVAADKPEKARAVLHKTRIACAGERKVWELSVAVAEDREAEESLLREMVGKFADEPKFALALGENLVDQERHDDAKAQLEPFAKHSSKEVRGEAMILLARIALEQDEPKKAAKLLKSAEKANPEGFDAEAYRMLGEVHMALRETASARKAFAKSLALKETPDALAALADIAIDSGETAEAAKRLRRLAVVAGDDPEILARAAFGYARIGRFDDASELAEQARVDGGNHHESAHAALGLVFTHLGDFAKAVDHLGKAAQGPEVVAARMRAHVGLGQLSEALELRGKAAEFDAVPPAALRVFDEMVALAKRRLTLRHDHPKSEADAVDRLVCAELIQKHGASPDIVRVMLKAPIDMNSGLWALVELESGRPTGALKLAETAIERNPRDFRGFFTRGSIRLERGLDGLTDLETAAKLTERRDPAVLRALASALDKSGKGEEAAKVSAEAAQLK